MNCIRIGYPIRTCGPISWPGDEEVYGPIRRPGDEEVYGPIRRPTNRPRPFDVYW